MTTINRRELLASAASITTCPALARAQSPVRLPLIAILQQSSEAVALRSPGLPVLLAGLRDHGYEAGRNVRLEIRFADGDLSRLPALARELVGLQPDVLFTSGTPGARAAVDAADGRIPVVIGPAAQITMSALVPDYGRPAANVTGLTLEAPEQETKMVELLKQAIPRAERIAILTNPDNQVFLGFVESMAEVTRQVGVELLEIKARNAGGLAEAVEAARLGRADAIIASNDGILIGDPQSRKKFLSLALQHGFPSASTNSAFAYDGGLFAFGVDSRTLSRRAAYFVHRILKGAKPADLPVERPTRIVLTLNLRTARALGLTLPPALLLRADEVLE